MAEKAGRAGKKAEAARGARFDAPKETENTFGKISRNREIIRGKTRTEAT